MTLVRNRGGCSLTNFFSPAAGLTPHTEDTHVESLFACTVYTIGRHGRTRAAKDVRINKKGTPKIAECWGPAPLRWGRRWPPRNRGYPAEFGRFRSNGTSVIKEIRLKNSTPRVPQFKVTEGHGTDTYRSATCNFL